MTESEIRFDRLTRRLCRHEAYRDGLFRIWGQNGLFSVRATSNGRCGSDTLGECLG